MGLKFGDNLHISPIVLCDELATVKKSSALTASRPNPCRILYVLTQ